jgi:hypothetical protein
VARQVERVGSGALGHGFLVEEPVVQVPAVAVEEDHRVARGVPDLQVAQATAVDLDVLGLGALRRRHRGELLLEPLLEVGDVGVDPGVRDRVVGDDAQERPHGHGLARPHQRPAQLAGGRALEDVRDLRGLDVHDLLALGDHRTRLHVPGRDHALLHRQAPLGHDDGLDSLAAHSAALAIPAPMTAWTAASILAGLGT